MAHNHGNEYQIRIIHEDGTEEEGGWMKSEEHLAQALAALPGTPGKTFWLRERDVPCPDCRDKEHQTILECRVANIESPRYRPHDSRYLLAVGSKSWYEVL